MYMPWWTVLCAEYGCPVLAWWELLATGYGCPSSCMPWWSVLCAEYGWPFIMLALVENFCVSRELQAFGVPWAHVGSVRASLCMGLSSGLLGTRGLRAGHSLLGSLCGLLGHTWAPCGLLFAWVSLRASWAHVGSVRSPLFALCMNAFLHTCPVGTYCVQGMDALPYTCPGGTYCVQGTDALPWTCTIDYTLSEFDILPLHSTA
jgi:hypothetical protein